MFNNIIKTVYFIFLMTCTLCIVMIQEFNAKEKIYANRPRNWFQYYFARISIIVRVVFGFFASMLILSLFLLQGDLTFALEQVIFDAKNLLIDNPAGFFAFCYCYYRYLKVIYYLANNYNPDYLIFLHIASFCASNLIN